MGTILVLVGRDSCGLLLLDDLSQLGQNRGEEPGDLHLTDSEAMANLFLSEVVVEPQLQDVPFARCQSLQCRSQGEGGVDDLERVVGIGHDLAERLSRVTQWLVQGARLISGAGFSCGVD